MISNERWEQRKSRQKQQKLAVTQLLAKPKSTVFTTMTSRTNQVFVLLFGVLSVAHGFLTSPAFMTPRSSSVGQQLESISLRPMLPPPGESFIIILGDDDDNTGEEGEDEEEDEDVEVDQYTQAAKEEFQDTNRRPSSALASSMNGDLVTNQDWGGALGKLRQRMEDVETGKAEDPSHALFRLMSAQTPNQVIAKFVTSANPQIVQAMSGAVNSLLGGLSNPASGVETIVKASGEKIESLCFQLQMTGYLFRNAEYVLALRDLLKIKGSATMGDYKGAFDRLDADGSGYVEVAEIKDLFDDVYGGQAPQVEINAFLQFFDQNDDGKISWEEFEKGMGAAVATRRDNGGAVAALLGIDSDDDEEDDVIDINTDVSGTIEIVMDDGQVVEVDAKDYVESLKNEAILLKEALRAEQFGEMAPKRDPAGVLAGMGSPESDSSMDIARYIASRQGDVKALTEGISPEIVETMKRLVDFVLEGSDSGKGKTGLTNEEKAQMEMEIPGTALQQLALWQLVLGYRLREEEASGEYKRLLQ